MRLALFRALPSAALLLFSLLPVTGCRAQSSQKLSPELIRRVQLTVRSRANLPFNYNVRVGERAKSSLPGFDELPVYLGEDGKPEQALTFLLSKDEKSLVQMNTFDLTKDPKALTSDSGRPARGGGSKAPVLIVGYDDLECPFCAKMHAELFPALLNRYGDKVRIVYKDFPLSQHPWAIHAAIDAGCLGDQSAPGYWNVVDYLHSHSDEIGGTEKSLTAAKIQIDKTVVDEGLRQKVDVAKLNSCIAKQNQAPVDASLHEGESLRVEGVPALFINGQQISGAVPVEYVYRAIDQALLAQGITPPAPVPVPSLDRARAADTPSAR